MLVFGPGVMWAVVAALLVADTHARNVTHEDIRDAMMSLVHMFRNSEDKLERHEYREKALGDQLKKMLSGLDKKHRSLEAMKGTISRLDDRLYNVENIFLRKEEREKETQKQTNEALEEIKKSLQSLTALVTENLSKKPDTKELDNSLTNIEDPLKQRLDATDAKLDALKLEIQSLKNSFNENKLRAMCTEMILDTNPLEHHISETEKLLNKYVLKLNEYNDTSNRVQTDFVPLTEVSLADEAWHSKMTEVMERQEKDINKIQRLLSDAESMWKDLPRLADLHRTHNYTLETIHMMKSNITGDQGLAIESQGQDINKIQRLLTDAEGVWKDLPRLADLQRQNNYTLETISELKNNLTGNQETAVAKINMKLHEMGEKLVATNKDIQQSLTEGNTMSERAFTSIQQTCDEILRTELESFTKSEHALQLTADSVQANKKRIEYGVHELKMEISELIKVQGSILNSSLYQRFDEIETKLLVNQTNSLRNMSSKIETELSQVWRQIGIMYKQLTSNRASLDKITEQTETYVNGTTATLDSMKEKVSLITKRVLDMEESLNYLLGRISLVTQEFSQIKTGLGEALDKAKSGFSNLKKQIGDKGPGPHPAQN